METTLAIAVRKAKSPDDLYGQFFRYFQMQFRRLLAGGDVRGTNILAHDFPDTLFSNRIMMGAAITGSLVAILDHETSLGEQAPFVPLCPHEERLDEIILEQAAIAGAILQTSDLVLSRVIEWERTDDRKYDRWLKALNKAARVHQRKTAAPITDRFSRKVKQNAVEQLRPMWSKLREKFAKQHRVPTPEQVKVAFEKEARSPDAPRFVSHPHNHQLWLRWLDAQRKNLVRMVLTCSVEKVFDSFAAFASGHTNQEYVRKKISLLK